jgi:integrase/recombinase XerD
LFLIDEAGEEKSVNNLTVLADNVSEPGSPGNPRHIELAEMADYDTLCLRSAGRKLSTISITKCALNKLILFLNLNHFPTQADQITPEIMRQFIIYLSSSRKYAGHPYTHAQEKPLSPAAINDYLRALRAAFGRWTVDGMIERSPFTNVRLPAPHYRERQSLSPDEIKQYLSAIDTSTGKGFSDCVLILTYFDTGARLSGLRTLCMQKVDLQNGILYVVEKGDKERPVFVAKTVQKLLWQYVKRYRPEPAYPQADNLFLTQDGRPLTKGRIDVIFRKYALKAGLDPHRYTPHVMRHAFCTHFMNNKGEITHLQAISGHSDIKTLAIYLHPGLDELKRAHLRSSPVDNLELCVGPAKSLTKTAEPTPHQRSPV